MVAMIRVAAPRSVLPFCAACLLAACSGGSGDAIDVVTDAGGGTAGAVGIWSGTLTPDDPSQPALTGWLTVAGDGKFHLDTDAALFTGTAQKHDGTLAATATGHPYITDFGAGDAFTFNGTVARTALTGKWSGGGRRRGDAVGPAARAPPVPRAHPAQGRQQGSSWPGSCQTNPKGAKRRLKPLL